METKFININKHQIAYFDNGVDATETIVCVHGNSSSKESFADFAKQIKDKRVVAFDLYGHGESDRAKDLDLYTLKGYVELLNVLINELNISNIHLLGHSLGGHISIESLPYLEDELISLVTFGTPPLSGAIDFASAFNPREYLGLLFKQELTVSEVEMISSALSTDAQLKVGKGFMRTDGKARKALSDSLSEGKVENEIIFLNNTKVFNRIIYGQFDDLINEKYMKRISLENDINVQKEEFSHYPTLDNLDLFCRTLNEVFSKATNNE